LRFNTKKNISSSAEFSKESADEKECLDDTEVTIPEPDEDYAKYYGYDTYENQDQRHSWSADSSRHRKTPRRSSLKNGSGPTRRARRHSLTFSSDVEVTTITPTQKLAKKKSLWFEEKDYEKMQNKIFMIADMAKEGEGHRYCTRGLENIIQKGSEERKYEAWDAVLDEQENQMQSGADFYDDDAVAQSYHVACEKSRADAANRAKQDEKAVAEYLSETRRFCRRMSM